MVRGRLGASGGSGPRETVLSNQNLSAPRPYGDGVAAPTVVVTHVSDSLLQRSERNARDSVRCIKLLYRLQDVNAGLRVPVIPSLEKAVSRMLQIVRHVTTAPVSDSWQTLRSKPPQRRYQGKLYNGPVPYCNLDKLCDQLKPRHALEHSTTVWTPLPNPLPEGDQLFRVLRYQPQSLSGALEFLAVVLIVLHSLPEARYVMLREWVADYGCELAGEEAGALQRESGLPPRAYHLWKHQCWLGKPPSDAPPHLFAESLVDSSVPRSTLQSLARAPFMMPTPPSLPTLRCRLPGGQAVVTYGQGTHYALGLGSLCRTIWVRVPNWPLRKSNRRNRPVQSIVVCGARDHPPPWMLPLPGCTSRPVPSLGEGLCPGLCRNMTRWWLPVLHRNWRRYPRRSTTKQTIAVTGVCMGLYTGVVTGFRLGPP